MGQFLARRERRDIPAASLDSRRESIAEHPRQWTIADLQAWSARESAQLTRDDDKADASARVARSILR